MNVRTAPHLARAHPPVRPRALPQAIPHDCTHARACTGTCWPEPWPWLGASLASPGMGLLHQAGSCSRSRPRPPTRPPARSLALPVPEAAPGARGGLPRALPEMACQGWLVPNATLHCCQRCGREAPPAEDTPPAEDAPPAEDSPPADDEPPTGDTPPTEDAPPAEGSTPPAEAASGDETPRHPFPMRVFRIPRTGLCWKKPRALNSPTGPRAFHEPVFAGRKTMGPRAPQALEPSPPFFQIRW